MQKTETRDAKSGFGDHSTRKGVEGLPPVLTVGKTIRLCAHIYGLTILLPVPLVAPLSSNGSVGICKLRKSRRVCVLEIQN